MLIQRNREAASHESEVCLEEGRYPIFWVSVPAVTPRPFYEFNISHKLVWLRHWLAFWALDRVPGQAR
jgi:hypothetical protein